MLVLLLLCILESNAGFLVRKNMGVATVEQKRFMPNNNPLIPKLKPAGMLHRVLLGNHGKRKQHDPKTSKISDWAYGLVNIAFIGFFLSMLALLSGAGAALVLYLLGVFTLSIMGTILGIVALATKKQTHKGWAIAAIILGIFLAILSFGFWFSG
jgi:hypothetical protein